MDWRFWKRRRAASETTVEVDRPAEAAAPTATPARASAPAPIDAPRFEPFAFEAPAASPPPAEPAGTAEDVRVVVRRKTGRRLTNDITPRPVPPGFEPVLVPSLREQALVYRLAAEQRAAAAPAEGLALWGAYLELCPDDAEAWLACGRLHLMMGAFDDATVAFGEARRHAKRDPMPLGALGYVAGCQGDWEAAVKYFLDAVALAPHDADLCARLAEAQEHAGHHEAAHDTRRRLETLRTP